MSNINNIPNIPNIPMNQVFNFNNFQQQLAKLNDLKFKKLELIEMSKDIKARLATTDKLIEDCEEFLASKETELALAIETETNLIEVLEKDLAQDEDALEIKNTKLSQLENIINDVNNIEYSIAKQSPIVEEVSNERSEEEIRADLAEASDQSKKANQHTKNVFSLKTEKDIDNALATPEGKAKIVGGLNNLMVKEDINLLTYEELVKGNIFSKRTAEGFLPDVIVSTILNRLTKAIEVDNANGIALTKTFKNHHNPVLTKVQKKRFNTFIRSNKVS